ncbi:MAG TPA: hypothetical protein VFW19_12425 [Allosphingosinicella sp.]|nr:hypothetical protein [Allosphingosinicella sp.]
MKNRHALLGLCLLFFAAFTGAAPPAPAAASATASVAVPAAHKSTPAQLKADWWRDNRWRYQDDSAANAAYEQLLTQQSPWPEWHQVQIVNLPVGLRFQMALAPGQPTDKPGGFGTYDLIPNVHFVRYRLAVKVAWKPAIDRVVTYEIVDPMPADTGTVGPQIDTDAGHYLPGGGSQFEMKVPASERMAHLKVVAVRPIQ